MQINTKEESCVVPFSKVKEAIDYMGFGSTERVIFTMLFLTGCRISEISKMYKSKLIGNALYWGLGKNQRSHRKEELPKFYIEELEKYRETHRIYKDKIFGVSGSTFRRYFNKNIRQNLSNEWKEKRIKFVKGVMKTEYVLQLKGLRKCYQTLEFANQLDKWKDASVALEFTSKKMKHSSKNITAYHYIENFDRLEIDKFKKLTPAEILKEGQQLRIIDFTS